MQKSLWRQVALVSYGNQYLQGKLALEDCSRHQIFWDARFSFRDTSRSLLADDFIHWLRWLQHTGARRLVLQTASVDKPPENTQHPGRFMLQVQFADCYQAWLLAEESPSYDQAIQALRETAGAWYCPSANCYTGEHDQYWLIDSKPGVLTVPETDWHPLASAIRADLCNDPVRAMRWQLPAEDFSSFDLDHTLQESQWATLPSRSRLRLPHQLLALLTHARAQFDNDTHCKNEGNLYLSGDAAYLSALQDWERRMDDWLVEVQLRAANELDWDSSGGNRGAWHFPKRSLRPSPVSPQVAQASPSGSPAAGAGAATTPSVAKSKLGTVMLTVLLCLITLTIAKLISFYPWLSVLIALPTALAFHYRDS